MVVEGVRSGGGGCCRGCSGGGIEGGERWTFSVIYLSLVGGVVG